MGRRKKIQIIEEVINNGTTISRDALDVAKEYNIEYSKYLIRTRAYPNIIDGMKSVHRRIVHCCYEDLPRKLLKSVTVSACPTRLHPHPGSIYDTIASMASKYSCPFPLFDTRGNFGDKYNSPSAPRYTECMLSDIAIKVFESFNGYLDMKQGDMDSDEPVALAALLPLCFLHGSYGIPSGMPTVNIPQLNPIDLCKYYIDILKHSSNDNYKSKVLVRPNIGNVLVSTSIPEWNKILSDGSGSIRISPKIELEDDRKTIVITGLPDSKSFDHILKILATEIAYDQVNVRDETSYSQRYVIEILPYKRVDVNELYGRLEKGLSASESYKFIFTDDEGNAIFTGFDKCVRENLSYTMKCCNRKFIEEIKVLKYKLSILEIIDSMKKSGDILKLVSMDNKSAIDYIISSFSCDIEQAKSVLSKPISYITKEHDYEIINLREQIKSTENNQKNIYEYLISMYSDLMSDIKRLMESIGTEFTEFK